MSPIRNILLKAGVVMRPSGKRSDREREEGASAVRRHLANQHLIG
jgi:hypothetical protein